MSIAGRSVLLFLLLSIIVVSCSKDENNDMGNELYGSDFFPTDSGITRIYQIDSVFWDPFTGIRDTVEYRILEVVAGTFTDDQGRPARRIERFRETGNSWIISRVESAVKTIGTAELTDNNNRYIKLVFPVERLKEWNGNSFNSLDYVPYRYEYVGQDDINGQIFNETARVIQGDREGNLIEKKFTIEKYASGIGLYYRRIVSIGFEFPSPDTASGFIYTERLTSFNP